MRRDAACAARLRFTKLGKVRFASHRDVARAVERACRVAGLPLAFTQGFAPRPRISFGLALPVGAESVAEYLDLELGETVDLAAVPDTLSEALPEGIDVTAAVELEPGVPSLQESVCVVAYRVEVPVPAAEARDAVARVLAAATLDVHRLRKGRESTEDVRSQVRAIEIESDEPVGLRLDLATRPIGLRAAEVLTALDLPAGRTLRTNQWIERDGTRWEPLEADAQRGTLTGARA